MRFFHLADLHLGKCVNGFSLILDQEHILQEVLVLAKKYRPNAIILAGDIYDRATPPIEAVRLYDDFLTELAQQGIPVLVVAGNHDSPERLGFAGQLLAKQAVHSYGPFSGKAHVVTLDGQDGPVDFHLLPFLRPSALRRFFPEETLANTQDALRLALQAQPVNPAHSSVLVAHQFATASGAPTELCDSETRTVGGLDEVDIQLFNAFAYVALGHIHGPQQVGRETVRYAGSPLKYSFSERHHHKAVAMVDLIGGQAEVQLLPLIPLRDMREISGPFSQLTSHEVAAEQSCDDYLRVVLTDELEVSGAMGKLRQVYPHVMELAYQNTRSQKQKGSSIQLEEIKAQTANQLFARFYAEQNGLAPNDAQEKILQALLAEQETSL